MNAKTDFTAKYENTPGFDDYFDTDGLQAYTKLGRNSALQLAKDAGAVITVGRRKVYSRRKITAYLESQAE